jgi:hypothetical protein
MVTNSVKSPMRLLNKRVNVLFFFGEGVVKVKGWDVIFLWFPPLGEQVWQFFFISKIGRFYKWKKYFIKNISQFFPHLIMHSFLWWHPSKFMKFLDHIWMFMVHGKNEMCICHLFASFTWWSSHYYYYFKSIAFPQELTKQRWWSCL